MSLSVIRSGCSSEIWNSKSKNDFFCGFTKNRYEYFDVEYQFEGDNGKYTETLQY